MTSFYNTFFFTFLKKKKKRRLTFQDLMLKNIDIAWHYIIILAS